MDESLKSIFGRNATKAIYYHLEKSYLLKLEDIPEKPQAFSRAIEEMFGKVGAEVIATLLAKDLRKKLDVKGKGKETDKLVAWLDNLRSAYGEK